MSSWRSVWLMALWITGCSGDPTSSGGPSAATSATGAPSAAASATSAATATASSTVQNTADPAADKLNVLFITIDSLRADMPWQGYDKDIAPNLTALAAQSAVYTRAYSVSSFTSKSVGGLLSGRPPSTLYRSPTFFTSYTRANVFFPELLQEAGVRTLGGHAHLYFDRGKNLRQGFDVWELVPGLTWNAETDESVTSPKMNELAIKLLADNGGKQFFMWLHYMDPHDKYIVHPESPNFGRSARNLYDNEVHYTDLHIGKLLEHCRSQPWWKNTVVMISSDHGEAFGEHNMWKHAFALWEVLTRVPLLIAGPGIQARRIDQRRIHFDLAPTILELMGLKPPAEFAGKSMVAELRGAEPDNREPILLDLPADTYNPPTRVAIKGDYKLIEDPGPKYKLFNLAEDPGELLDLAPNPKHKATFDEMLQVFQQAWSPYVYMPPYGTNKLVGGAKGNGPKGPPGWVDPDGDTDRP